MHISRLNLICTHIFRRAMSSTSAAAENSTKSLFLWTAGTPNGHKPSILLEELKTAYPGKPSYARQL